jgi:hypothetical protein
MRIPALVTAAVLACLAFATPAAAYDRWVCYGPTVTYLRNGPSPSAPIVRAMSPGDYFWYNGSNAGSPRYDAGNLAKPTNGGFPYRDGYIAHSRLATNPYLNNCGLW